MATELSVVKGTFYHNGFEIELTWFEGTNVFGKGERYVTTVSGPKLTGQWGYKNLHEATHKFNEMITHSINWTNESYKAEWLEASKVTI